MHLDTLYTESSGLYSFPCLLLYSLHSISKFVSVSILASPCGTVFRVSSCQCVEPEHSVVCVAGRCQKNGICSTMYASCTEYYACNMESIAPPCSLDVCAHASCATCKVYRRATHRQSRMQCIVECCRHVHSMPHIMQHVPWMRTSMIMKDITQCIP